MTYPEKGAGYRHMPKFMDRALAAERRADGGEVSANNDPIEPMPSTAEKLEHGGTYLQRMRDDENNDPIEPMPSTAEKLEHGGTYLQRMRDDEGGRGLSDWRGSFGDNEKPSRVRADNHKRGGRVRKRADGGNVTTPYVQGTNLASAEAPLKLLRPSPQDQQDQKMGRAYRTFGDAYSPNKRNGGRVREGD